MSDELYKEMLGSLKLVLDLTSRIDERVKILIENDSDAKERIDKLFENQSGIISRLTILENKNGIQQLNEMKQDIKQIDIKINELDDRTIALEKYSNSFNNKWRVILEFGLAIAVIVISGVILWRLGISL